MHILIRLFLLLTPYWKTLILSALLLIGRAGLELVPPLFHREIIDGVITAFNLKYLGVLIAALVGTYALSQLVQIGDNYIRHALGEKFIFDLRVRLYAYLQKMSLSFFERTSTGELMSRVTNDLSALEHFVTHGSALTAVDLIRLIGGSIILFVLDWRLALARAILADPRILILDEATSSVDAKAEFLIQQALERVLEGRSSLVIAHRLSTVRNANKIIVLDRGRIVETGKHEELLQRAGLYSQLYKRQMANAA
jgi:ABC-type multidrug transport system fused ATPase/permease subunit